MYNGTVLCYNFIMKMKGVSFMSRLNIRIDDELKDEANELFNDIGIDMSTAIKIFLRQSVREKRVPFILGEPLESTQAREEALEGKGKIYENVEEMMQDINEN